jgi:hypothetical protein
VPGLGHLPALRTRRFTAALDAGARACQCGPGLPVSGRRRVRSRIDHTLLRPDATREEIRRLCQEARENASPPSRESDLRGTLCRGAAWYFGSGLHRRRVPARNAPSGSESL